jgi:hypothetical protein
VLNRLLADHQAAVFYDTGSGDIMSVKLVDEEHLADLRWVRGVAAAVGAAARLLSGWWV